MLTGHGAWSMPNVDIACTLAWARASGLCICHKDPSEGDLDCLSTFDAAKALVGDGLGEEGILHYTIANIQFVCKVEVCFKKE